MAVKGSWSQPLPMTDQCPVLHMLTHNPHSRATEVIILQMMPKVSTYKVAKLASNPGCLAPSSKFSLF